VSDRDQGPPEAVQVRLDRARLRQSHLRQRRARLQRQIEFLLEEEISNQGPQARRSSGRLTAYSEPPSISSGLFPTSPERASSERAQLLQLRSELNDLERQIEDFDSLIAAMQIDLAYELDPGQHLAEISRAVGQERGADLSLRLIFARWWTLAEPARTEMWSKLETSADVATDVEHLLSRALPAKFRISDLDAYEEFLEQVISSIGSIEGRDKHATQSLLAEAFEAVVARSYERTREAGVWETPNEFAELMSGLVCQSAETIVDPTCGMARTLLRAGQRFHPSSLLGVELNKDIAARAWMRLQIAGCVADIRVGDAFEVMRNTVQHDAVVLQPPFNMRLSDEQEVRVRELIGNGHAPDLFNRRDLPWILLAYAALRPGGRAAVALPAGCLRDVYRRAHQYLIDQGAVEGVISFPEGGIFPHTRIGTALWLLRRKTPAESVDRKPILLIDADSLVTEPGAHAPALTADGVAQLVEIVERWRESWEINVPRHVAVSVPPETPELSLGLNPHRFLDEAPVTESNIPEPPNRLLKSFFIENFKSFNGRTRIPLAPLTVIFGANSAGKSTIIQSLLLLRQSVERRQLITQGPDADVGGFSGVVHYQRPVTNDTDATPEARVVGLGVEYGTLNSWVPPDGVPNPSYLRTVEFRFTDAQSSSGALATTTITFGPYSSSFRADHRTNSLQLDFESAGQIFEAIAGQPDLIFPSATRSVPLGPTALQEQSRARNALRQFSALWSSDQLPGSTPIPEVAFDWHGLLPGNVAPMPRKIFAGIATLDEAIIRSYLANLGQLTAGVSHEVIQLLKSVVYLGPLRSPPQRFYNRSSTSTHPGDAHHIAMYLFDHSNVVKKVNEWLNALEVPYTLDVVPVRARGAGALVGDLVALSLTDVRSGAVVTPADVGFGISQMLPIVVELLAHRESIICVEQPETHLHPRLQTRLADLLIESSRKGDLANQVIVETHSEHLMLRLQRRIREGSIDPDDVSILYVDQTSHGVATVKQLRIDSEGEFLDEWPHGFFDERLDELFGTT